jgi:hypothetical protein
MLSPLEEYCRKWSQNSHVDSLCSALPRCRVWVINLERNRTRTQSSDVKKLLFPRDPAMAEPVVKG